MLYLKDNMRVREKKWRGREEKGFEFSWLRVFHLLVHSSNWLQQPGLGQPGSRSLELCADPPYGRRGLSSWVNFCCFSRHMSCWIRSGTLGLERIVWMKRFPSGRFRRGRASFVKPGWDCFPQLVKRYERSFECWYNLSFVWFDYCPYKFLIEDIPEEAKICDSGEFMVHIVHLLAK